MDKELRKIQYQQDQQKKLDEARLLLFGDDTLKTKETTIKDSKMTDYINGKLEPLPFFALCILLTVVIIFLTRKYHDLEIWKSDIKKNPEKERVKKISVKPEDNYSIQIEGYNTLPIYKSYRGIAVLFFIFSLVLTMIVSLFSELFSPEDVLFSFIIYAPILYFIYKGYRGAMILMMVLWIIEKIVGAVLYRGGGISWIIFLIIGIQILWKAIRVENLRKKEKIVKIPVRNPGVRIGIFCGQCGNQNNENNKFCSDCGNKLV